MKRKGRARVEAPSDNWLIIILWYVVAASSALIGVVFQRNPNDSFRIAKMSAHEGAGIVCIALIALLLLWRTASTMESLRKSRLAVGLTAAIVLWTGVTAITSTNRLLSKPACIWVVCCAAVFIATILVAQRGQGLALVYFPLAAAALNALLTISEFTGFWSPTDSAVTVDRYRVIALIGNSNDLGVYLLFAAIAALAILVIRANPATVGLAALLTVALFCTQTLSAIIAFLVAVLLMTVVVTRRIKLAVALVTIAVGIFLIFAPLRNRVVTIVESARHGSFVAATTFRLPAYIVAWQLFKEHPLTGTGPGTFSWWYFPKKLKLDKQNPEYRQSLEHFGEAHNDHLQTLAVSGLPGYLLFAASIVALAMIWFRPHDDAIRSRFAKTLSLPLAGAFAVAGLAHFPLEVAPTTSVLLHLAALCCAWSPETAA